MPDKIKSNLRRKVEQEVDEDLKKPIKQLLADIHEEIHADRPTEANIAGALKRTASMMGRVSQSNEALAKKMKNLTKWIFILTIVIVIIELIDIFLNNL
ncbi:hypothetical protein ACFLSQ_00230 [Bacteroidota bacterium]